MNIQEYPIVEKAVYQGVATGIEKLLQDVNSFSKPEVVVETVTYHVMSELCDVIDFGQQALKFSPQLIQKMWAMAREEAEKEGKPPAPEEAK